MRKHVRRAKEFLSSPSVSLTELMIETLFNGEDFQYDLSEEQFIEICSPVFDKILPVIEQTLLKANLQKEVIDEVILVGGSTRIPKVRELLTNYFGNATLSKIVNPDNVVAQGAAI